MAGRVRVLDRVVREYTCANGVWSPGDVIATGTPPRLSDPPGPDRHLEPGDALKAWIEGIGEMTTTIA